MRTRDRNRKVLIYRAAVQLTLLSAWGMGKRDVLQPGTALKLLELSAASLVNREPEQARGMPAGELTGKT